MVATYRLKEYSVSYGVLPVPPGVSCGNGTWHAVDANGATTVVDARYGFFAGIRSWLESESASEGDMVAATFKEDSRRIELEMIKVEGEHDGGE